MTAEFDYLKGRKDQELRLWHSLLNDDKAAWYRPEFQHASLRKHAEVLHRFGIIDGPELIELNELADARYGDAIERMESRLEGCPHEQ
ncbi:hypothetical protein [Pseudomonas sp. SLFW]|uniref:hypothetical protein n=1 Tax=Pseudomonas sp. SLFW TaxID=2683259 RepID=UPI0014130CC7|nr:hypothetical protein [Pseudomonas sp. SLFW]NBB13576.1 hypothetical protein [Pseudomonas sp. SLFW]